ncbi:MAG TPA: zinc ribbon domain-containing protein [Pyrinomonadaceae bacterium]|nr:zinc ribbon domain-containing protein [Pyrinomonadaceae bacterium]
MFCPKCATQNLDGASFCRSCGANISLIPQALTGEIAKPKTEEVAEGMCGTGRKELTLDQAFKNMFMGIAFLLIAIVLSRTGMGGGWWFWLLLPAFSLMGTGIAQCIRVREREKRAALQSSPTGRAFQDRFQAQIPARPTDDLMAPVPSVTEGTTRHLGVEAPTRHLDADERK